MRLILGALAILLAGGVSAQGAFTATVNQSIPDNNSTGVSSTITIPATGSSIGSLRVGVRINHGWDEDIQIWLIPPGVTWNGPYANLNNGPVVEPPAGVVQLSTKNGGSGDNYGTGNGNGTNYTNFTSSRDPVVPSSTSISAGSAPFTSQPRWTPEGLDAWDRLIGTNPSGDWRIVVVDGWAAQTGTFLRWQLAWQPVAGTRLITRLSQENLPGSSLVRGSTDQAAGHLEFQASGGTQTITSVALQAENGVALNANFSRIALHEDLNGNGMLDSGEVVTFSGTIGGGSNITLSASPAVSMTAGSVRRYLVVADVLPASAATGVSFRITGSASISSSAPRFALFPVVFGYHPLGTIRTFASAPLNGKVVPNNKSFGVRDTIRVPATTDQIGGLRVGIRIDHSAAQDLDVYLLPPGVQWMGPYILTGNPPAGVITLTRDEGANGNDYGTGAPNGPYVFTNFSSSIDTGFTATVLITAGGQKAPFTAQPTYRPIGEAGWNTLYGTNPGGDWTLIVADDSANGQGSAGGTLVAWQIDYLTPAAPALSGLTDWGGSNVGVPSALNAQTYGVSNVGGTPLVVTALSLVGANAADWSFAAAATLPISVPSGSTHNLGINFTPSALGLRAAALRVTYNNGLATGLILDYPFVGQGTQGVLATPTGPVDYGQANPGTISSLSPVTHVVSNTGNGPLTITDIALSGSDAADWAIVSAPVLPAVVAPSASLNIQARLIPGAAGARTATLRLTSDSGAVPGTFTDVLLTGIGTQGVLATALGPVDYGQSNPGTVSSLSPLVHVINNTGDGPLTVSGIALTGANAPDWTILSAPALPVVIAPNAFANVQLQLIPGAIGARSATLRLTSDSGAIAGTFADVALTGAGTYGELMTDPGPVNFGAGLIGEPSPQSPNTHIVSNIGSGTLSITAISILGPAAGDCSLAGLPAVFPVFISPSGSIQFDCTCVPSAVGPRSATLRIESDTFGVTGSFTDITLVWEGLAPTSITGVMVGEDLGGPLIVYATVNGPAFSFVDVAVTYSGGSNPGPALIRAGTLNVVGNVVQNVPANSVLTLEWDAYATELHTTAANYVLTMTPSQGSIVGTPGSSGSFALERSGGWAQHVTPGGTPTGLYSHTMMYDTVNDRVVVFGGRDSGAKLNTVWVLERSGVVYAGWRIIAPAGPQPEGRQYANAIYDAANGRMILFGGLTNAGPVNDAWSLDLTRGAESWTQIAQASPAAPAPRRSASLVYDAARNRALLFAGWNGSVQYNDAWALNLQPGNESWGAGPLTPSGAAPSARFGHAAALDETGDCMIVFGGRNGGSDLADVHQLSLAGSGTWSQLSVAGPAPLGRYFSTHAWDSTNRSLVVQSGFRGATHMLDVWHLDLSAAPAWTELPPDANAGIGRVVGGAAFDAVRQEILFFGGLGSSGLTSPLVSVLDVSSTPVWTASTGATPPDPEGRWGAVMAWDNVNARVVLWGGRDSSAYYGDVWVLDRSTPQGVWSRMAISGARPAPRVYSAFAMDALNNRLIIHGGGLVNGQLASDLWSLDLDTGTWTLWSNGAGPAARDQHTMVYDSMRGRAVLYGGRAPSFASDVWAFDFGATTWTQIVPLAGAAPDARHGHGASYDSVNDRLVIVGGRAAVGRLNDVWALSLAPGLETWTQCSTFSSPVPTARQNFGFAADANGTRIWLHAGDTGGPSAELWELNVAGATASWNLAPMAGCGPLERFVGSTAITPGGILYTGYGFLDNRGAADLWAFDTTNPSNGWTQVGEPEPDSLVSAAYAYDPVNRRMIAFGGLDGGVHQTGLWQLDMSGPVAQWSRLNAGGTGPGARRSASMVYDGNSVPPRILMFGGRTGFAHSTITDELWALQLAPGNEQWVQLNPAVGTPPGARTNHGAVVDGSNRMIVFGGLDNTGSNLDTVFALDLATLSWTQMTPAGTGPSARYSMSMVFDAPRNRIVIHGGATGGGSALGDSFVLDLGGTPTWGALGATGTGPGSLYYHSAVVDAANQRMLVFGGYSGSAQSRLFELDLVTNNWTERTGTIAKPQARWSHSAVWDAPAGRMVIAGGYLQGEVSATQDGGSVAETWFWGD